MKAGSPFILIYGETNVGKSTSCLATLPEPILDIVTEPRDPSIALRAIGRRVDVTFVTIESPEEVIEFLGEAWGKYNAGEFKYRSIVLDSASFLMNVEMRLTIEDQNFDSGIFKKDVKIGSAKVEKFARPFVDQTRLDRASWGAMSSQMARITRLLGRFASVANVVVVITALLDEKVRWDATGKLSAAPAFTGTAFPVNAPSYFDLIGLVKTRTDGNGNVIYPPNVFFVSPDGTFVAKWTGPRINATGPLDFTRILLNFQKDKKKEKEQENQEDKDEEVSSTSNTTK